MPTQLLKQLVILILALTISGCASYGVIENQQTLTTKAPELNGNQKASKPNKNTTIILAFSGGGNRAAALSYGVLKALNGYPLNTGTGQTLLDEVDSISAVSGGSVTAAYYGLVGKDIFSNFTEHYLYQDNERKIVRRASSLSHLSSNKGRSEAAIQYFDEVLFNGAQIEQLHQGKGPQIIINSSDLGGGVRLSFTPVYFSLLCSDVKVFPIARAVVASAAVPLLFNPIVVQNFDGCSQGIPAWLTEAEQRLKHDEEMSLVISKLETLTDKEKRKYIHLVDGGITDNLGLRAIYETVELAGGAQALSKQAHIEYPKSVVVIVVDASTDPIHQMDSSLEEPSISESITALTDIQIHRYNAATLKLFENKLSEWANSVSTPSNTVTPYMVKLRLADAPIEKREYLNNIPTSLSLTKEQADTLIELGNELLQNNSEFREFLSRY